MKILVVADTVDPLLYDHFRRDRFPDIELILSAGDLPAWYLSYLMSVFNAPLYYVRGNHDYDYDREPPEGGEDIDCRIVKAKGLKIMGFEGSMFYHSPRAVQRTEWQMWWQWQKMRPRIMLAGRIDIVLTHAPPFGIHDAEDQCHKGFLAFSKMIHKYQPRYFIHGHTHLNYSLKQKRIDVVNNTEVINGYGYHILDTEE
ncbi:MAG: metallophosphoesterase [Firmicutes bacterium]|jgi:Icc-related predicted phosphoesterase|nr:metallophosphoesterase family protein [Bacillota bacterium]NLL88998.1 metallophosphoesterase [Bacillota bacterium]HKM17668.1 metallophosphoesterase [Limnochordia bacterium]